MRKSMKASWSACAVFVILFLAATAGQQVARIDDAALARAGRTGDDWLTYGLNQAETRFSPLTEINAANVNRLSLAWSYDVGPGGGGQEATPLVSDGTIYGITNWSIVFAVDARTGKEKWRWDPQVNQVAVRPEICCGVVNRGLALYDGMVFAPVIDGRLQALDAGTGKVVWEARVAFPQDHFTITMAPRIAKGKVIIGVSGGDRTTRGFFDAYDPATGHRAWRVYTIPGDPSKPFESEALRKAAATWDVEKEWWKYGGGGAVWDGLAFDADAGLVYVGTGNAQPWTFLHRSSKDKDNLYAASILAVDVDTGQLKWHYQVVPGDNWDFDSVQHLILADLSIGGRTRKVIMQANKNAFFYVIDRITGEFISAQPFSYVTWAKGIDQKTGRPIVNEEAYYGTDAILIQPGGGGAHNWSPMSFNPMTGLVYIPTSTNNSFSYAAEPTYEPQPGRMTGTVRPAPTPVRPSPAGNRSAANRRARRARRPCRLGPSCAADAMAQAGRRRHRRRHDDDGRQSGVSDAHRRAAPGVQRGQGRQTPRGADRVEQRYGTADHVPPGRQAVRRSHGGVGTVMLGNAGPGNSATPFAPKLLTFSLDAANSSSGQN
jgi:quinohemoprotein ethanol dehydrogenase